MNPFINPIKEAGLEGFRWRDSTILEEMGKAPKLKVKRFLFYFISFLIPAIMLYLSSWIALGIVAIILLAMKFFKVEKAFPKAELLYPVVIMIPLLINSFSMTKLLVCLIMLLVCGGLFNTEVTILASVLAISLINIPKVGWILSLIVLVFWVVYSLQNHYVNAEIDYFLHRKENETCEPLRLPVGYYKEGKRLLKKSLNLKGDKISRRHFGSIAERKTAKVLLGLPKGSFAYHDFLLPGADVANIDHLAITPHGVFDLNTKVYTGNVLTKVDGKIVKKNGNQETNLESVSKQMRWEQKALSESLQVPVKPIVVIHQASVDGIAVDKRGNEGNVAYISISNLIETIRKFPIIYDDSDLSSIQDAMKIIAPERKPVYAKK